MSPPRRLPALLAVLALAACRPGAILPPDRTPADGGATPGMPAGPAATPGAAGRPPAPRVRVVPGVTPEPAPPGAVVEGPEADPEEIAPGEDVVTLEAPAAYRGPNDLGLQVVLPHADDPSRAATTEAVAVELELREDTLVRDPVVVRTRLEGPRLASGRVPVVVAGLRDDKYELVVRSFDRSGAALGGAERDFGLEGGIVAPYVVRLPASRGDYDIDEAPQPYLQGGTPTSMNVLWTGARATVPHVTLTDAAGAPVAALEGPLGTRHRFAFEGLRPATTYRWAAREDDVPVGEGTFRTAAGPEGRKLRFAAIGDMGKGNAAQAEVAARMAGWKPEFVIVAGDVVYPAGEAKHYGPRFLQPYRDLVGSTVFYPSLGNHDYLTAKGQPYLDFFEPPRTGGSETERYYAFRWGHAELFALDSNQDHGTTSPQTRWLAKALAASDATWKIAFFHHPPYSSGWHGSSEDVRDAWGPLFEKYDVQLVVTGHDHHYERMKPQEAYVKDGVPTHYLLTGGGGASLRGADGADFTAATAEKYHFVGVTIDDRTLAIEAIDGDGVVFDRWRYTLPK
jgi:hypothetical protein